MSFHGYVFVGKGSYGYVKCTDAPTALSINSNTFKCGLFTNVLVTCYETCYTSHFLHPEEILNALQFMF